jgi:KDO2-lipid IV(A) lauroyltransferase
MLALVVYLSADLVTRVLPVRLAERFATGLARLAFALRLPARRQLQRNLAWLEGHRWTDASPTARARLTHLARAGFEHFALSIVDFLRLSRLRAPEMEANVEVRGREHLDAAERSGKGVIVLSAHAGCWEWGAAYLAALGRRVHVVARPHRNTSVERFFARRRRQWRVARLCSRPLWIGASRALRRSEWVALTGDRETAFRATGTDARHSLCAWVAALSRRTGALILPAVMLRLDDGRYAACFDRPLTPEACLKGGYRDALRRLIGEHGEQWSAFEPLPAWLAPAD